MPYIAIKVKPKDEETKKRIAQNVAKAIMDSFDCERERINISIEEIPSEDWDEKVVSKEINPNKDKFYVLWGKDMK